MSPWNKFLGAVIVATGVVTLAGTAAAALTGEAREHDGLYVRLGVGFGYGVDTVSSDSLPLLGNVDVSPHGLGGVTEIAVGYTILNGFVLGGGIYSLWFSPSASEVKNRNVTVNEDVDFDTSSFHVIGPFVDYYLNSDEGLHLEGGLGLALVSLGGARFRNFGNVETNGGSASGLGLMLGIGDEWWVSDSWSLGVSGRLTMGFMSGSIDVGPVSFDASHTAFAPAVLFTATFN